MMVARQRTVTERNKSHFDSKYLFQKLGFLWFVMLRFLLMFSEVKYPNT